MEQVQIPPSLGPGNVFQDKLNVRQQRTIARYKNLPNLDRPENCLPTKEAMRGSMLQGRPSPPPNGTQAIEQPPL